MDGDNRILHLHDHVDVERVHVFRLRCRACGNGLGRWVLASGRTWARLWAYGRPGTDAFWADHLIEEDEPASPRPAYPGFRWWGDREKRVWDKGKKRVVNQFTSDPVWAEDPEEGYWEIRLECPCRGGARGRRVRATAESLKRLLEDLGWPEVVDL
ncbi:MAG TPA: hypothetical protein VNO79_00875 [Actinomycetota bacterium]|nr:hypothetical protein [Actinomycetota bacterium]